MVIAIFLGALHSGGGGGGGGGGSSGGGSGSSGGGGGEATEFSHPLIFTITGTVWASSRGCAMSVTVNVISTHCCCGGGFYSGGFWSGGGGLTSLYINVRQKFLHALWFLLVVGLVSC
jgi:hypothetical protein